MKYTTHTKITLMANVMERYNFCQEHDSLLLAVIRDQIITFNCYDRVIEK